MACTLCRERRRLACQQTAQKSSQDGCAPRTHSCENRYKYNHDRPHDALALEVPLTRYRPSPRSFPSVLPPLEYSPDDHVRKVQDKGEISFHGHTIRLSRALHGYPVGLRPTTTDGHFDVYFCHQKLTHIDLRVAPL